MGQRHTWQWASRSHIIALSPVQYLPIILYLKPRHDINRIHPMYSNLLICLGQLVLRYINAHMVDYKVIKVNILKDLFKHMVSSYNCDGYAIYPLPFKANECIWTSITFFYYPLNIVMKELYFVHLVRVVSLVVMITIVCVYGIYVCSHRLDNYKCSAYTQFHLFMKLWHLINLFWCIQKIIFKKLLRISNWQVTLTLNYYFNYSCSNTTNSSTASTEIRAIFLVTLEIRVSH